MACTKPWEKVREIVLAPAKIATQVSIHEIIHVY